MPQNKLTEPQDDTELPILNHEEEALVEAWAQGHDQTTCYRMAYGAAGYSAPALKVRACRKFAESKIQAHLRALQASGLAKVKLTLEERLSAELAFAQRAENAGNFGAAGQANDRVNKLMGLYVEKTMDVTPASPHDTLDRIEAEYGTEVAVAAAQKHGIADWAPSGSGTRH